MQAVLLLKPSYVFFRSVPELHQTQDSTDLPSELLRERGLYFLWSLPPTPGHGTGTRLKASAVPLCPAIYTPNLLPTIHIAVYTYRCIYGHAATHAAPAVLILHSLISIFPFPFLISTSLFIRLLSSIDFYFAKVSQAGNTENTGTSPIGGKLFMTLRNHRLRFPENFYRPILCLMSP